MMLWFYVLLLPLTASVTRHLDRKLCGSCHPSQCPVLSDCAAASITRDPCECCYECSKEIGDKCGGIWKMFGSCGRGLTCKRSTPEPESVGKCEEISHRNIDPCSSNPCPLRHHCWSLDGEYICKNIDDVCGPARFIDCKSGHCRKSCIAGLQDADANEIHLENKKPSTLCGHANEIQTGEGVNSVEMCGTDCRVVQCVQHPISCPWDSVYDMVKLKGECCNVYRCQCSQRFCERIQPPSCADGFERMIVKQGNGRPGSCCNLTACRRKSKMTLCHPDHMCPDVDSSLLCPPDSAVVGMEKSDDRCCELGLVCKCLPCKYWCDDGYYPRLLRKGTGTPGECCHQYDCKKDEKQCLIHVNKQDKTEHVNSGYRRRVSECEYSLCTNGLWSFQRVKCSSASEQDMNCVKVKGECCPVCFDDNTAASDVAWRDQVQGTKTSYQSLSCRVVGGKVYNDSDLWRPGDCIVCKCVKGVTFCVRPRCSDFSCAVPHKLKGECCPLCDDQRDTPDIHITDNPLVIHPTGCNYGGNSYAIGFSWAQNCRTYHCGGDGQMSYMNVQCPAPNCSRTASPFLQNKCCLNCQEEEVVSKCHFKCNRTLKLSNCSKQIVLVHVPYQCCPKCYNISELKAVKREHCKSLLCGDDKVCCLVRMQGAYSPTQLTVKFQCVRRNTTIHVQQNLCSGSDHSLWLAVELSHDQLSRPDTKRQFIQYLQSLLWETATVHLFEMKSSSLTTPNRTRVKIRVQNSTHECVLAATVSKTITSNKQQSHKNHSKFVFEIIKTPSRAPVPEKPHDILPKEKGPGIDFEGATFSSGMVGIVLGTITFAIITVAAMYYAVRKVIRKFKTTHRKCTANKSHNRRARAVTGEGTRTRMNRENNRNLESCERDSPKEEIV